MKTERSADEQFMQRAIGLARSAAGDTAPNPMVGAVIVLNEKIIGEGCHRKYGEAHAEVNAINSVEDQDSLSEATIYVTLEPCAHFGKTPPCADLLVAKKLKRVVIGIPDPFAEVSGKGIGRLQAAGIETEVNVLRDECYELNKRFFTFHKTQKPYVILKWAQSADGFTDRERDNAATGINWITTPETKVFIHKMRSEEQAILVGWKTIRNDNPSLTTRAVKGKNPLRFVIDPQLRSPRNSIVYTDGNETVVFNSLKNETVENVRFIQLEDFSTDTILKEIHKMNCLSVIVEGGASTIERFIAENNWNEAVVLTGKARFESGLRSPSIDSFPYETIQFGADIIQFFRK